VGCWTETELKIPVADLNGVRERLSAADAELRRRRQREVNVLFDTLDGALYGQGRALRLRRFGQEWILTHKGPARYSGQVKHREELELGVADGEVLAMILERLGLVPWVRYEKDREVWRLQVDLEQEGADAADPEDLTLAGHDVEICLDHTPLGDFVELEGPERVLGGACEQLGLDPGLAVRGSYVALWDEHRLRHPEAPRDMVFEP